MLGHHDRFAHEASVPIFDRREDVPAMNALGVRDRRHREVIHVKVVFWRIVLSVVVEEEMAEPVTVRAVPLQRVL